MCSAGEDDELKGKQEEKRGPVSQDGADSVDDHQGIDANEEEHQADDSKLREPRDG